MRDRSRPDVTRRPTADDGALEFTGPFAGAAAMIRSGHVAESALCRDVGHTSVGDRTKRGRVDRVESGWDHGPVNQPTYPPHPWGGGAPDPGLIPLRPLLLGDVVGVGFAVVRRHLALLGTVAVLISVGATAAEWAILSGTGSLDAFASGDWIAAWRSDLAAGRIDSLPIGIYAAVGASSLISVAGTLALSGLAAGCAGVDAVRRHPDREAVRARLRGRIGALVTVSVLVAAVSLVGSLIFVVPGLIAYAVWAVAAPAAVMEGARPGAALIRSARLTQGRRWRVLGVTLTIVVLAGVIDAVVASIVTAAAAQMSAAAAFALSGAVGAVVAGVTASWVGAVIGLLYVDARLRSENLAPALRAYAATLPPAA